jgi:prepilin-type N-terminal cleavage/methylation domain-containing protein
MLVKARTVTEAGFTLTEIMIVVAVIGLLAVIAIPAFARARARSAQNLCISNLRRIEDAKAQWALDTRKGLGVQPHDEDLFGPALYIRTKPKCPAGGQYDLGKVKELSTCTITGHRLFEDSATAGSGQPNGGL